MAAMGDAGPAGRGAREFDRGFNAFGAGIGEERLFEMRHAREQALGQNARQRRDIHLNEVGKFAVEHLPQRVVHARIAAPDGEHAESAQQVEIFGALPVPQILALAPDEACVEADGLEHPHHLLVQMARVQPITFGFALSEQGFDVNAHFNLPPPGRGTVAPVKSF